MPVLPRAGPSAHLSPPSSYCYCSRYVLPPLRRARSILPLFKFQRQKRTSLTAYLFADADVDRPSHSSIFHPKSRFIATLPLLDLRFEFQLTVVSC